MSSSSSSFSTLSFSVIPIERSISCGDSGGVGVGVEDGLHLPTAMFVILTSFWCISDGGGGGGGLGVGIVSLETSSISFL